MRLRPVLAVFIAGSALTSLFFTNCGESVRIEGMTEASSQSSETQPVALANNPFENQKTQFNFKAAAEATGDAALAQKMGLRSKAGLTLLPAGTRVLVVLHNQCESPSPFYDKVKSLEPELPIEIQTYVWELEVDTSLEEIMQASQQDECVRGVTNDAVLNSNSYNDPYYGSMTALTSLNFEAASKFFRLPSIGAAVPVTVAIIDSGIDYNHPDLKSVIARDASNKIIGYDYRNADADPLDDYGHGTAIAGIIAATGGNGIGTVGIMPQNVKIIPLKVQDQNGSGLLSDVTRAIEYSIAVKADVINISMAGETSSATLFDALQRAAAANIFVAVAAGNSGVEISTSKIISPAFYGASVNGVMTVGSIDTGTSSRSSFSNYSSTYVEVYAPGKSGIVFPCPTNLSSCSSTAPYATGMGTSYAAPMVAAAAALTISVMKTNGISYTASGIEAFINKGSRNYDSLRLFGREGRSLNLEVLSHYLQTGYTQSTSGGFDDL